jgi:Rod binding domain-containing protein
MTPISAPTTGRIQPGQADPVARMRQAAKDFEAMTIKEMLRPMFETVDNSKGPFGGGSGEAAWQPMMVDHIAKHMAARGGIGLSGAILDQMVRMQEAKTAAAQTPGANASGATP